MSGQTAPGVAVRMLSRVFLVLVVLSSTACSDVGISGEGAGGPAFLERGSEAPPFDLPVLTLQRGTGRPHVSPVERVRLSDLQGQVVLLHFWATWCGPCVAEHPEMVRLAARYRSRGVAVLGVLHRDSPTDVAAWLAENGGLEFPILVDPAGRVGTAYRLRGVPQTVLIDRSGRLVESFFGRFAPVEEVVDSLLSARGEAGP